MTLKVPVRYYLIQYLSANSILSLAVYDPPISGTPGVDSVASPIGHKGKSQQVENKLTTPVMTRPSSQKRIEDYSALKGKGRYGNSSENNQYAICFFL